MKEAIKALEDYKELLREELDIALSNDMMITYTLISHKIIGIDESIEILKDIK